MNMTGCVGGMRFCVFRSHADLIADLVADPIADTYADTIVDA